MDFNEAFDNIIHIFLRLKSRISITFFFLLFGTFFHLQILLVVYGGGGGWGGFFPMFYLGSSLNIVLKWGIWDPKQNCGFRFHAFMNTLCEINIFQLNIVPFFLGGEGNLTENILLGADRSLPPPHQTHKTN